MGTSNERRQRGAQPARGPHHSLTARTFLPGKPMRNDAGCIGIGACRAHPEEKTGGKELPESTAPTCECGKDGPPSGDARELATLSVAVAQGARRDFENGVGDHIRTKHPSPLHRREAQIVLHRWTSHSDGKPIEEGDYRNRSQQ